VLKTWKVIFILKRFTDPSKHGARELFNSESVGGIIESAGSRPPPSRGRLLLQGRVLRGLEFDLVYHPCL